MRQLAQLPLALIILVLGTVAALSAGEASGAPPLVVLDGLTSLFGEVRIFLEVDSPGLPSETISLIPGQAAGGIKLLAVDVRAATVRIDNHGQVQTLKICAPPELVAPTLAPVSRSDGGATLNHSPAESTPFFAARSPVGDGSVPANPAVNSLASIGAANALTSNGDGKSPAVDSPDSGAEPANAKTHIYYWWMEDAKKIEQSRLATTAQVLAGELPAEPLTPLTPPGTPANLIGPYSVYMEHGRGMVVSN